LYDVDNGIRTSVLNVSNKFNDVDRHQYNNDIRLVGNIKY